MLRHIVTIIIGLMIISWTTCREVSIRDLMIEQAKANQEPGMMFNLPSNATAIRPNILNSNFNCTGRAYGMYADPVNDCQIFYCCYTYDYGNTRKSRNQKGVRWDFICPQDTKFDQAVNTCVRDDDMSIPCEESEKYYPDTNAEKEALEQKKNDLINDTTQMTMTIPEKTTPKTFLTDDDLLQKLIQRLPGYNPQPELYGLNEDLMSKQDDFDDVIYSTDQPIMLNPEERGPQEKQGRKTFLFRADAEATQQHL